MEMDRQERIEYLREHYTHPHKRGAVPTATVEADGGNPGCGDVVRIYLEIEPDGTTIKDVHFTGEGCTISQASASVLMEALDEDGNKTLQHVLDDIHAEQMEDLLGKETMQVRPRCATLSLDTLKAAIRKYQREKLMREHGLNPDDYKQ
jgi:nitrogen fixation NifU-like protein